MRFLLPLLLLWPMAAQAYTFEERSCASTGMRCGVIRVPEDYSKPDGRKIALNVIVLPATDGPNKKIAQYDFEGGPGFDVAASTSFYAVDGAAYHRTRDVVLADQRGTGASHPLRCPKIEDYDRQRPVQPMYPVELVKDCAGTLSRESDLTQYTTANSARDVDAVRRALGYDQLSLNALSYGTTLALRYIADFPDRVQSAVLMGTVPAERTPPRYHAQAASDALALVIADCAADAACAKAFSNLASEAALPSLTGDARATFFERLRSTMYSPAGLKNVPFFVHRASAGDFAAFDSATKPGTRVFADGLYLSITCNETFARIDADDAIVASAKTTFGAYRLERQRAACAVWPRGEVDAKLFDQRPSDVPILFISGAFDPVSPPQWAEELAASFPNSHHITVARGSHVLDGLSGLDTCLDPRVIRFVDTHGAVDQSCFAEMRNEPYRTQ